jgi:hypothetical protein
LTVGKAVGGAVGRAVGGAVGRAEGAVGTAVGAKVGGGGVPYSKYTTPAPASTPVAAMRKSGAPSPFTSPALSAFSPKKTLVSADSVRKPIEPAVKVSSVMSLYGVVSLCPNMTAPQPVCSMEDRNTSPMPSPLKSPIDPTYAIRPRVEVTNFCPLLVTSGQDARSMLE